MSLCIFTQCTLNYRFIPDGMEFDEEPKWQVTDMPDTVSYRPTLFNCKALNQSQVKINFYFSSLKLMYLEPLNSAVHTELCGFLFQVELTWDETDKKRTEVLMRKFNKDDLEKMDMKDYLASSSSEDEGNCTEITTLKH